MHAVQGDAPYRQVSFWALAGLCVLLGCAPVWTGQWLPTHERPSYLFRAAEFTSLLAQGDLYPRWCPDFYWGYGYPFFVFYAPGLFYLSSVFQFLGLRADAALQIVTILGTAGIFFGGYRFCRLFARDSAAQIGAVLTTLATYRFVQYYVRGDLAEGLATSLVPWTLAEGIVLCRRRSAGAMARLAVLLALVFYVHTLTAIATSAALTAMGVAMIVRRQPRAFLRVGASSAIGLLVAGAQWIPAFFERRYVSTDRMIDSASLGAAWSDHFVTLWQRISPRFGFGRSIPGPDDEISFASSWVMWVIIALAVWFTIARPAFRRRTGGLLLGWAAVNLVQLSISRPVWLIVPYIAYFQFPWRFLLLDLVLGAALAAAALDALIEAGLPRTTVPGAAAAPDEPNETSVPRWSIAAVAVALAILCAAEYPVVLGNFWPVLRGQDREAAAVAWYWPHVLAGGVIALLVIFVLRARRDHPAARLALVSAFALALPLAVAPMCVAVHTPMRLDRALLDVLDDPHRLQRFTIRENDRIFPVTTAAQDEYRPRSARIDMAAPPAGPARMRTGAGAATVVSQHGDLRRYSVRVAEAGTFEAAYLYYPGVRVAVDDAAAQSSMSDLGLVSVPLSVGQHAVDVWYGASPAQKLSYWITALGAALVAALSVAAWYQRGR